MKSKSAALRADDHARAAPLADDRVGHPHRHLDGAPARVARDRRRRSRRPGPSTRTGVGWEQKPVGHPHHLQRLRRLGPVNSSVDSAEVTCMSPPCGFTTARRTCALLRTAGSVRRAMTKSSRSAGRPRRRGGVSGLRAQAFGHRAHRGDHLGRLEHLEVDAGHAPATAPSARGRRRPR